MENLLKIDYNVGFFLSFKTDQGASSTLLEFMFYSGFEFVLYTLRIVFYQ